ncbi:hypothetical protein JZO70_04815 [Enterococcus sp. 669A]|uniref:Uncharacterized protein n=1 Tax=Candidatus Enterococcus moelleringii TaxID=2815325 RepID=A0ABS3L774_9ENTE|nr:hypothetical protein [Enterococcus sp. 669A]MBO1305469.1 hypothetical protein [Enterococcus sp. 669A]
MGEPQLYSVSQLHNLDEASIKETVRDWLVMTRLLLEPVEMSINGEEEPFDLIKLSGAIGELTLTDDKWFQVKKGDMESTVHFLGTTLFEKTLINESIYQHWEPVYLDYLSKRLEKYGFFGYIRAHDEYLYHNTSEIEKRRRFESAEKTQALPKMRGINGELVVDCNSFPGYDVFHTGHCLTSCWRMFYGEPYKQLFPKQLLLEIQQVERVVELGDGVVIELYKNPFQWNEKANLKFQRLFRDQLGVPQLSFTNGVGLLKQPYIEFAFEDTVVQTVQYQNEQFQPAEKSEASYFVTRTYDFINDQYRVHRMKGALNALAYFPWIDDREEKMMNYHILYPERTLDQGLAAYEYYIRDAIELELSDKRYYDYTAILKFFIPERALEDFPLEGLKGKLTDMNIRQISQDNNTIQFSLEKGKNQLMVVFADQRTVSGNGQINMLQT